MWKHLSSLNCIHLSICGGVNGIKGWCWNICHPQLDPGKHSDFCLGKVLPKPRYHTILPVTGRKNDSMQEYSLFFFSSMDANNIIIANFTVSGRWFYDSCVSAYWPEMRSSGQEAVLASRGTDLVARNASQMGFVCSRDGLAGCVYVLQERGFSCMVL